MTITTFGVEDKIELNGPSLIGKESSGKGEAEEIQLSKFFTQDNGVTFPKASGNGIKVDTAAPTFPWQDMVGVLRTDSVNPPALAVFRGGSVREFFLCRWQADGHGLPHPARLRAG